MFKMYFQMQGSIQYIWNQNTYWNFTDKAISPLYI